MTSDTPADKDEPDDVQTSDAADFEAGTHRETFGFEVEESAGEDSDGVEYKTDIGRLNLGIDGLDRMVDGGVPEQSLITVLGGAGTGKTTFGLQFLNAGLKEGERGVYFTLEEGRNHILQSAEERGWDYKQYEDEGELAVINFDPVNLANSLASIRNELPGLIDEFDASRLVLDSVSLLEMMYDDQARRRTEIYDFARALKAAGVTTLLTSEVDDENPFASRYGIIEYLTDAVVVLRYVRPEEFQETRLAVEIKKIRGTNHSRQTKPYELTNSGISVYEQADIF